MSSDNPYSAPPEADQSNIDEDGDDSFRSLYRILAGMRTAVLFVAMLFIGFAALFFIQVVVGINLLIEQYGIDRELLALDGYVATWTLWKLVSVALLGYLAYCIFLVSAQMKRVLANQSIDLLPLISAESKFWWAFAISGAVFVIGLMLWSVYVYFNDFGAP
jgi:hypothetical protein